jgi:hypothetical protein
MNETRGRELIAMLQKIGGEKGDDAIEEALGRLSKEDQLEVLAQAASEVFAATSRDEGPLQ